MRIIETAISGLLILESKVFADTRGAFQKIFNHDFFVQNGLPCEFKEIYYSLNHKDVVRGMHFQAPPFDHTKLVHVSQGSIIDVVLDIRKASPTFGNYLAIKLNHTDGKYVYIPSGFAHGYVSLEDNTIVNYAQTSCYSKEHDLGIAADSFGFDWQVEKPIRSGRDLTFPNFSDFSSPF